jgi:X box-binding protein 1
VVKVGPLPHGERLQRRKLKNRVAAQNARDKKKAQTEEMEKVIEQMRIEKQLLAAENARLLALTEKLQQENIS